MSTAALVMARAPQPGRVKTRLEPMLGPHGCAMLQARLTALAARLAAEAAPGAAFVAVDPPEAAELLADLVGDGVELFGQSGRTLGERLADATEQVFERAPGHEVITIGTDAPLIGTRHFDAATELLASGRDAALGPALDGGYYLIALARPLPQLFAIEASAWGGDQVLGLTLRAARAAELRVGLIEPARDLDTPADAKALLEEGGLPEEIASLLRQPE